MLALLLAPKLRGSWCCCLNGCAVACSSRLARPLCKQTLTEPAEGKSSKSTVVWKLFNKSVVICSAA
jgi:hypothetical protein